MVFLKALSWRTCCSSCVSCPCITNCWTSVLLTLPKYCLKVMSISLIDSKVFPAKYEYCSASSADTCIIHTYGPLIIWLHELQHTIICVTLCILDHAFTFLFKLLVFVTVRLSLWEHIAFYCDFQHALHSRGLPHTPSQLVKSNIYPM